MSMRLTSIIIVFSFLSACGGSGGGGGTTTNNTAPAATDGTLAVNRNTSGNGALVASDADGDTLTYSVVTNGTLGAATITDTATGTYTYTPNADAVGTDTFTFNVNDGTVDSNTATITVTINPAFTINTSGGRAGNIGGFSGSGGLIDVNMDLGNTNLSILNSGVVDASFTPSAPTANLGETPLTIDNDTTLNVAIVDGDEPAVGVPYLVDGSFSVYISDANGTIGDETPVTGIEIADGVTLTLGLNDGSRTRISLFRDMHNLGTITTLDSGSQRGGLRLDLANYIANSEIDTAGTLTAPDGGEVTINAEFSIYNGGSITTRGIDVTGAPGGDGGDVNLNADDSAENSATIDAQGGGSDDDSGGNGGAISINANDGSLYNSGDLLSHGGDGGEGNSGNSINLFASQGNGIRNSGRLDAYGGNGLSGNSGSGGSINISTSGGAILSSGSLNTSGGDTQSTADSAAGGGSININVNFTAFGLSDTSAPLDQLDIRLSGDIDTSGGDAPIIATSNAGSGGSININQNGPIRSGTTVVLDLLGYTAIDTHGGDGNNPGSGGSVTFQMNPTGSFDGFNLPGGNIINQAAIITRGGSVDPGSSSPDSGNGGSGGQIWVSGINSFSYPYDADEETLVNSADLDSRSGDSLRSATTNPSAGQVYLFNRGTVSNNAAIDASGGNDDGVDGVGNSANQIILSSMDGIVNSGNLLSLGGSGELTGGDGEYILLEGMVVENSGALTAAGGDADPALTGSFGGSVSQGVELRSPNDFMGVINTGLVDVSGGDGETPGDPGYDLEGSLCLSGDCP